MCSSMGAVRPSGPLHYLQHLPRAEFPIQLVGRLPHQLWLLLHQLYGLPHLFLMDFGAIRLRNDHGDPELYRAIRFLSFPTLKRLIFTMLALKPSANITVCPTNFAKEAPPMTSSLPCFNLLAQHLPMAHDRGPSPYCSLHIPANLPWGYPFQLRTLNNCSLLDFL